MPVPDTDPATMQATLLRALQAAKESGLPGQTGHMPVQGPLGTEYTDAYGRRLMMRPDGTAVNMGTDVQQSPGMATEPSLMQSDPTKQGEYFKYMMNLSDNPPTVKAYYKQQYDQYINNMTKNRSKLISLLQNGGG